MPLRKIAITAALMAGFCNAAFAGGPDTPDHAKIPRPQNYGYQIDPDPWLISTDIYAWMTNMSGYVTINNVRYKVKQRYEEMLHHLRLGGMLWMSASKGPFSMFFNGLYTQLLYREYLDGNKIKVKNNFAILAGGFSYRAYRWVFKETGPVINESFSIVPYLGLRATMIDTTVKATNFTPTISEDQHWLQPFLGSRFIYQFASNWGLTYAIDYGYWGSNSYSTNMIGLLSFNNLFDVPALSIHVGYRFMHQYYERDNNQFKWDMNLYGPIIGMSVTI